MDTVCYSILSNNVQGFFITINDPDNNDNYFDLYLNQNFKVKKKVEIINQTPYIKINCKLEGNIYSIKSDINYSDDKTLSKISKEAETYLQNHLYEYLYKTSKIYKSDISGFGNNALSNFLTTKDFEDYDWENNYQYSFFDVKCNVCIKSGNLITEI